MTVIKLGEALRLPAARDEGGEGAERGQRLLAVRLQAPEPALCRRVLSGGPQVGQWCAAADAVCTAAPAAIIWHFERPAAHAVR